MAKNDYKQIIHEKVFEIFDMLKSGISIFSKHGDFIYTNDCFEKMFGLKGKTHIGKHVTDYFFSGTSGVMAVLDKKSYNMSESLSKKNMHHGFTYRYPLTKDNEIIGCITETIYTSQNKQQVEELKQAIINLTEKVRYYENQLNFNISGLFTFENIIGDSAIISKVKQMGKKYALGNQQILITGESGTGKELFAQAIHTASPRANNPFVAVNCAAIPQELMESELFGYAPGAFSGASTKGMKGKFELAHKGTIFLDEIGELPMPTQAKLLRVLESGEIQKIGKTEPSYIDFRLVTATNRNLKQMVKDGGFREDLYHRINILNINIPPLRERSSDIELLTQAFLIDIFGIEKAKQIKLSDDVLRIFKNYEWPGNIRELKNILIYVSYALESNEYKILPKHLPENYTGFYHTPYEDDKNIKPLEKACYLAEKEILVESLKHFANNKSSVAKELGISRKTLYKKLHMLGLA